MEAKDLILQLDQYGIDEGKVVVIYESDDEFYAATNVTDYKELDNFLDKCYNHLVK